MGMIRSAAEVPGDEGESWLALIADLLLPVDVSALVEEGAVHEGDSLHASRVRGLSSVVHAP